MGILKFAATLIAIALVTFTLIIAKQLLIPFVIAFFIWYITVTLSHWIGELPPIKKYFPAWANTAIAALVIGIILVFIALMIVQNATAMIASIPKYQQNLDGLVSRVENAANFQFIQQIRSKLPSDSASAESTGAFAKFSANLNIGRLLLGIVSSIGEVVSSGMMILIYVIFIFFEQAVFPKKMKSLFSKGSAYDRYLRTADRINEAMRAYFTVKVAVSALTATCSYLVLLLIGVDFAFFWAFLIFILNFIPNIGSLIATVFPATIALVQFDTVLPFFEVVVGIGVIQLIVGNFLEPRLLGSSLNISSLVVLFALMVWGTIWGITGMVLCVPITVMIMIVLAQFPSTRSAALLLSENGELLDDLEKIHEASEEDDIISQIVDDEED
ncbi:MAG: AI-2E family transporter [Pyrinomonadaceae bacterium]